MSHKAVKRECADIFELSRQRETNFSREVKNNLLGEKQGLSGILYPRVAR